MTIQALTHLEKLTASKLANTGPDDSTTPEHNQKILDECSAAQDWVRRSGALSASLEWGLRGATCAAAAKVHMALEDAVSRAQSATVQSSLHGETYRTAPASLSDFINQTNTAWYLLKSQGSCSWVVVGMGYFQFDTPPAEVHTALLAKHA